ncbi:MAG: carboxypeptidase-like regulatory domain-containing protein [Gemmatimonadaceae bacterium]
MFAPAFTAAAQGAAVGEIAGVAVDRDSAAVAGVQLQVDGSRWRAVTDDRGVFRFEAVVVGSHRVIARRIGFLPESLTVTVSEGKTTGVRLILRAAATELDAVDVVDDDIVSARLQGFEQRRAARRGGGQFLARADIDRIMPVATTDLIRRLQGVRIVDSLGVSLAISTRGPKIQMIGGRPIPVQCVVRVGVDGWVKEPYFPMNSIPRTDIHGIEVYAGAASLPSEFAGARRDAACGLIMIWTRTR